jgi:pimeloyl-ACP methyl ester carboxylesterase
MLLVNTSLLGLILAATTAAINLPRPEGRYGTGSSQAMLVDHFRGDPFAAAAGIKQVRKLMVSSFYPVALREQCLDLPSPYMPETTAAFLDAEYGAYGIPNNTFASFDLIQCKPRGRPSVRNQPFPTVLFSPGLGNSRLLYSAMAQSLASEGFNVITIDHPYDADIVEFEDGSTVLAADLDVRVQDVSFVIDQLQVKGTRQKLFGGRLCAKDEQYTIFGHSLGGATAAAATLADKRLNGAINLDGTFFGALLSKGAAKPLMIVSHDGKNLTTDDSWSSAWNVTQRVTKVAVTMSDTAHGSYSDLPLIADALGLPEDMRRQLDPFVGALPGTHVRDVVAQLIKRFTAFVRCESKNLLPRFEGAMYRHVSVLEESKKPQNCR